MGRNSVENEKRRTRVEKVEVRKLRSHRVGSPTLKEIPGGGGVLSSELIGIDPAWRDGGAAATGQQRGRSQVEQSTPSK